MVQDLGAALDAAEAVAEQEIVADTDVVPGQEEVQVDVPNTAATVVVAIEHRGTERREGQRDD